MAGQNDFLIFDENRENLLPQDIYVSDQERNNGFKKGLARSNVNNKVLYQTSKMCHALGELIVDNGDNASDESSVDELKQSLKDMFVYFGNKNGHAMFDIIFKDHILDFYESKGFALLGSYVYKTAIAGSRFGYPSFFNKCIEEQAQGKITEVTLGENTITMYINSNGHQFYDISDKEKVDIFYNSMGIAWFYGVDTTNERIFLPRNDYLTSYVKDGFYYVDYDMETRNAMRMRVPLEDGLGRYNMLFNGTASSDNTEGLTGANVSTDFGRVKYSGTSYKTSDLINGGTTSTLTPSAVNLDPNGTLYVDIKNTKDTNKIAYMVVGNTEVESLITDVIDVTTTENDTLPLLHHIPSDELLEHPSWLRSTGEWNDGNVYTSAYNYLVNEYQTGSEHTDTLKSPDGTEYNVIYRTVKGKKVVDVANIDQVTAVYSAIGSAWYYVIDQDNMLFRLPQSHNSECYTADPTRLGLDISAGLPNITGTVSSGSYNPTTSGAFYETETKKASSPNTNGSTMICGFDASLSNPIYGNSETVTPAHTEFYLYFKVANAVQNLQLLDVGEVLEAVSNKVDINSDVIDGQWVTDILTLLDTSGKLTQSVIDLSEYLPNDGCDYEVKFKLAGYDDDSTYGYYLDTDKWITSETAFTTLDNNASSVWHIFGGVSARQELTIIDLPVGSERWVRITGLGADNIRLFVLGYRRIGKNI